MTPKVASRLRRLIRGFSGVRVLVVGDLMLDRFVWGRVRRISPEAPVPVVHVTREEARAGGAGNVVSNVASLGGRVAVCGVVGVDAAGRELTRALQDGKDIQGALDAFAEFDVTYQAAVDDPEPLYRRVSR